MTEPIVQIAVADDQVLFRQSLVVSINRLPGMQVIAEAADGMQLIQYIEQATQLPHLVLLDLNMPGMNGMETTAKLHHAFPDIRIIILSVHSEPRHIIAMMEKGINGFLSKSSTLEEVSKAIHSVYRNGFYFSAEMMKAVQGGLSPANRKFYLDTADMLTKRETEILILICRELTTPEIAKQLFVSERTVEGHRNNLLMKTGARNTAGLVLFALRHKLIDPVL